MVRRGNRRLQSGPATGGRGLSQGMEKLESDPLFAHLTGHVDLPNKQHARCIRLFIGRDKTHNFTAKRRDETGRRKVPTE